MKGKVGETRGEIGIKSDWIGQNVIYFPNFGHFYFPAEGGGVKVGFFHVIGLASLPHFPNIKLNTSMTVYSKKKS